MSNTDPERAARSKLEDEGIPDIAEDSPEREWTGDPEEAAVPGSSAGAAEDFGTTAEEQEEGEPLDGKLRRERPEVPPNSQPDERSPVGRLVAPDEGESAPDEAEATAEDLGADRGGFSAEEDAMHLEDEN
ncbi:MAG TPA: DUF5709 domain-containing protein [Streptosporangiaceae bacterium]|jgi:hypothetical protein